MKLCIDFYKYLLRFFLIGVFVCTNLCACARLSGYATRTWTRTWAKQATHKTDTTKVITMHFKKHAEQSPLVIAHRGGSLEAPENTLPALERAVRIGSDVQEIDVTLSQDGKIVVIHDDTVARTTNWDPRDGTSRVEEMPYNVMRRLSAGNPRFADTTASFLRMLDVELPHFETTYAAAYVPTLQDVLAIPNTQLMIELKKTPRAEALAIAVVQAVHEAHAEKRVGIASFDALLLARVHALDPSLPLIGIVDHIDSLQAALTLPLSVIAVRSDWVGDVLEQKSESMAVWVWTVYRASDARMLAEAGVDGVITDAPSAVLREFKRL